MKIGIDARFFGSLGKGLGRYTQRLIENLEELDHTNEYVIFLRKENWEEYQPINENFKKVPADYKWYGITEQIMMPFQIWRNKIDLMHFPHFNVPLLRLTKFVVTIHDLILLQFPTARATTLGPLKYKLKEAGYKAVISSAVKNAEKVITVSNYTKDQLVKYFSLPTEKIEVTYESGKVGTEKRQREMPLIDFKIEGITKPYFLYVGNAYPHKNIEGLLKAFRVFIDKFGNEFQLVLVGKSDYFYERLKDLAQKLNLLDNSDVVFLGYVEEADLAEVYKNASLYVFPSFFEGFGLPALEAMQYKLPVASAKSSCLPEILGNSVIYFDPSNLMDMAERMYQGLTDEMLRETLIQRGLKRIELYSWEDCAQKTLIIYKQINGDG